MEWSSQGYSTDCSGHLVVGDDQFPLVRLGPSSFELATPVTLPRTYAEIVVVVDGDARRTAISLTEGSSGDASFVSYRRL